MPSLIARPTRIDHFPKSKDLVQWLEDHGLPVSKEVWQNVETMIKATGGRR